ncbi:MAG: gamma-glutamyltransferase [Oscillospiraceae bacterium]|jgi:gamma-glutamyltranspeptidase/glutathione hydrolase|nr:gamma-glutamyltransferase [Oscillospiraceae bacterium]
MAKTRKKVWKVLKWIGITLLSLILALAVVYFALPKGPRAPMAFDDPFRKPRTVAHSNSYMAAAGTPWAAQAAVDVMENGGNAFDAAMAALLALNVTFPQAASFPGVAPILLYNAKTGQVESYIGAGTAPQKATVEYFRSKGLDNVPKYKLIAQLLPASPDVLIAILKEHGTLSFSELCKPAIHLAREGFPVHGMLLHDMGLSLPLRAGLAVLMPYNAKVYFGGQWWRPLHQNDRMKLSDLANSLQELCDAEQQALNAGKSREEALDAVRAYFYEGPIAEAIAAYHEKKDGLITLDDLKNYAGGWEAPLSGGFGEYTIYANDTWNQGGVVPMALQILDGLDLKAMGHNSPEYIHTVAQAIELAMADREAYFGDPAFVEVPIAGLLSPDYAAARRELMTPGKAFGQTPPAGTPAGAAEKRTPAAQPAPSQKTPENALSFGKDTSYITVIDNAGNAVSLTPSDFPESPMIPGTGLNLGTRMTQFYLDDSPNGLLPGKRPRITPNPSMVLKNGELFMSFGTPGGESQTQAIIQVFLNITVFGMDPQEAISAPRFISLNWPNSFAPHEYYPGQLTLEASLYEACGKQLEAMGYQLNQLEDWDNTLGAVCAIIRDPATGELVGGADPREESWAIGG